MAVCLVVAQQARPDCCAARVDVEHLQQELEGSQEVREAWQNLVLFGCLVQEGGAICCHSGLSCKHK